MKMFIDVKPYVVKEEGEDFICFDHPYYGCCLLDEKIIENPNLDVIGFVWMVGDVVMVKQNLTVVKNKEKEDHDYSSYLAVCNAVRLDPSRHPDWGRDE